MNGRFRVTAGPLLALPCVSACAPGDDASAWDEGVYHVTVDLDTADRLLEDDTGGTATVNDVADTVCENLSLKVRQYVNPFSCNATPAGAERVVEMQAWVGNWSANLLLPEHPTCFYLSAVIDLEEIDLPSIPEMARYLSCGESAERDSLMSTGGEQVDVQLTVQCEWRYEEGECEGDGC